MKTSFILIINFTRNNILYILIKNIFINKVKNLTTTLYSTSSGKAGFKNKQKITPFACTHVILLVINKLKIFNIKNLILNFKGKSSLNSLIINLLLKESIFKIESVIDTSSYAFNGCKVTNTKSNVLNEHFI